jgi:hypothetical protein
LLWSDLRSGTLLTFIETDDLGGETDTSYDPASGDWWINVSTQEEAAKAAAGGAALVTTVTNDGEVGDFSTGNFDWTLTIARANNQIVFGPVGEGANWPGGGISNEEVGKLEGPTTDDGSQVTLAMWQGVTPTSNFYDDSGNSSFGAPNQDYDSVTGTFTLIQDLSALRGPSLGSGDFDNDGQLTAADINALTAEILAGGNDPKFDVNVDSAVDSTDRQVWVEQLKQTYFGDSNLDGEFNSQDLIEVLAAGQYEDDVAGNSGWAEGDWNGDADFTTTDFVDALAGGGYEAGPRAAVRGGAAVPEPQAAILLAAGLLCSRGWRRGR